MADANACGASAKGKALDVTARDGSEAKEEAGATLNVESSGYRSWRGIPPSSLLLMNKRYLLQLISLGSAM